MPFALLFAGAILIAAGVNGQTSQLFTLVKGDIEGGNGEKGYIYWMTAILIIGAIGYVPDFKVLSRAFMALVLVVLFLKTGNPVSGSGGFFEQFFGALGINPTSVQAISTSAPSINPNPIIPETPLTGGGQIFVNQGESFQ